VNGLRQWDRDATLPAQAGEVELTPFSGQQVAALAHESLLVPNAPGIERIDWTYARWKPGVSMSAGYALRFADGEERALHVKRYLTDKASHLAERQAGAADAEWDDDRLLAGRRHPEEGLSISCFPHDKDLPGLSRALDLRRTVRQARERGLFGDYAMRAHRSSMTLLRYRPERRAVFRLDAGLTGRTGEHEQDVVAVRVLPPGEARRVAAARLQCRRELPLPRLLMAQERTGILLEEWLDVDVPEPDAFGHAERAGSVLAVLHGASPRPLEPLETSSANGLGRLFAWHPRLAPLYDAVPAISLSGVTCWTHGDFHPDQVATDRDSGMPRLLDLDRLGPGLAVDDLASWIADHIVEQPGIGLAAAAAPLLQGYAAAGGLHPSAREMAAAVGRALVQRAAASVRRLERGAVTKAERLLEQSRELCRLGASAP